MSEVSIGQYEELVESAAWFRELPAEEQGETLKSKMLEELGELLLLDKNKASRDIYKRVLRGGAIDPNLNDELRDVYVSEAGDVLYCLAASGLMDEQHNITFGQIVGRSAVLLGAEEPYEDLEALDISALDTIDNAPTNYQPDYFAMQFFNIPPLEVPERWDIGSGDFDETFQLMSVSYSPPIRYIPDGYYVLERTLRNAAETLNSTSAQSREDIDAISVAVGAIAAVGVNRFGVGMQEIVNRNTAKLERRLMQGTIRMGEDPERSSGPDKELSRLTGWGVTCLAYDLIE